MNRIEFHIVEGTVLAVAREAGIVPSGGCDVAYDIIHSAFAFRIRDARTGNTIHGSVPEVFCDSEASVRKWLGSFVVPASAFKQSPIEDITKEQKVEQMRDNIRKLQRDFHDALEVWQEAVDELVAYQQNA